MGTASKPNRRLTGGSVRFRPVAMVLNNDNRPAKKKIKPNGTERNRRSTGGWVLKPPLRLSRWLRSLSFWFGCDREKISRGPWQDGG